MNAIAMNGLSFNFYRELAMTLVWYIGSLSLMLSLFVFVIRPKFAIPEMEKADFRTQIEIAKFIHTRKSQVAFGNEKNWKYLRKQVFRIQGKKCLKCGIEHENMHIDHIKPKSIHPHLEFMIDNLQVLCPTCNKEKSNKDETDYRKSHHLMALVNTIKENKLLRERYTYDFEKLTRITKEKMKFELAA